MTVAVLTSQACGKCMVIKNLLKQKGIQYQEISVTSELGRRLTEELSICSAGAIVDLDGNRQIGIADL